MNGKAITLPTPDFRGPAFETVLKNRRSVRRYADKPLSLDNVSQLVFAAQGKTGGTSGRALRTAPSAGALYPLEVYAVVNNVEGLSPGIYQYDVDHHTLAVVKSGDFRGDLVTAGLGQRMLGDAGVTFVFTAVFDRIFRKYGDRGLRYIYMEAGHCSQNIALQAVSSGLGSVCVGAFYDDRINALIGVDGEKEAAVYLHAVGALP